MWQSDFEEQQNAHIKLVIFEGVFVWCLLLFFVALFFLLFIYTHLSFIKISSISVFYESKFAVELPMYEKHLYAYIFLLL